MKIGKKSLSVLLSVLMSFSLCFKDAVKAEETPEVTLEEETAEEVTTEEESGTKDPETLSEEILDEKKEEEPSKAEEPEQGSSETEDEAEPTTKDAEQPEGSAEEEENEDHTSVFSVPDGFSLQASDSLGKEELFSHDVLEQLETLKEGENCIPKELILITEEESYAKEAAAIFHGELVEYDGFLAVIRIMDETVTVADAVLASLQDESLPLVEPNYIVKSEPEIIDEDGSVAMDESLPEVKDWSEWVNGGLTNPDPFLSDPSDRFHQWYHSMIHTYKAWNATMGSRAIKVAVIDQTINEHHEELAGKAIRDDVVEMTKYGSSGHGTMMSTIIAGKAENGKGGSGIAPGVSIVGINIFAEDYYTSGNFVQGINRAINNEVNIISMSLGGPLYSYAEEQVVNRAYYNQITLVAAAGNNSSNIRLYPGAYEHTIAVGSVTKDYSKSFFSNYGSWVTVSAPGSDIATASTTEENVSDSFYRKGSGTSQATAVVSGALALYMSQFGPVAPDQAETVLKKSCVKCPSSGMGAGVIDLEKMFGADTAAPVIQVFEPKNQTRITDFTKPLPAGSFIRIVNPKPGNNDVILYTTDGKKPTIKDGSVVNGELYTEGQKISIDTFEQNKTVKITAVTVNSVGVAGNAAVVSLKTPVPASAAVKIKSLKLNLSKVTLGVSTKQGVFGEELLSADSLIDVTNAERSLDTVDHQWISSNPKVAEVDENGRVKAVSAGSAKITLKILDGSNKTAACSITVVQLAESIQIDGQDAVVPGTSASYKAVFQPAGTKMKTVQWSLKEAVDGVSIDAKGKLTVASSVPVGSHFQIIAKAMDGSGAEVVKTITAAQKATAISVRPLDSAAGMNKKYDKSGSLTALTIFTVDLPDDAHPGCDNEIDLKAVILGNDIPPVWTSSNPKVAEVDENGKVRAVSAGSAKITAFASDGSKKKAVVSVTVAVPVSGLSFDLGFDTCVAEGKSQDLNKKLMYGSVYGKPSVQKASWEITDVYSFDSDENQFSIYNAVSSKAVSINNGKLSVNKNFTKITGVDPTWEYVYCTVKATAQDGSGCTAETTLMINGPFKKTAFMRGNYDYLTELKAFTLYSGYDAGEIYFFSDQMMDFEVTSSNPDIAGCMIDFAFNGYLETYYPYSYTDGFYYRITIIPNHGPKQKHGKITISVKAHDGSNITKKISGTVY